MNVLQSFDFEGTALRVFGDNINPIFVAADICKAIGIQNPSDAIKSLAPFERVKIDLNGREVNAVNESGLYTLILRSRDAVKEGTPAYRFRVKVTAEILPAIRRTGRYECPANPQYLTDKQCWAIQSAVGKRARGQGAHFQTIYHALKARFQVPTYTRILSKDFDAAIAFIQTCELKVPVTEAPAPQIEAAPQLPEGSVVLTPNEAELLLTLIYYVRFLFSDTFEAVYKMMLIAQSPISGRMYDAFHEIPWGRMLDILARHGHDISDMPCYKHWLAGRRAA